MQYRYDYTALHYACRNLGDQATSIVHLLLQSSADPNITDDEGLTPLALVRKYHPTHSTTIALLEQVPDAQKTFLLVKAPSLVATAAACTGIPVYLQGRTARLTMAPVADGQNNEHEKEDRKLCTTLAFFFGKEGGPKGEGMPRDVFRVVMDMLMPSWDPLRLGIVGTGASAIGQKKRRKGKKK